MDNQQPRTSQPNPYDASQPSQPYPPVAPPAPAGTALSPGNKKSPWLIAMIAVAIALVLGAVTAVVLMLSGRQDVRPVGNSGEQSSGAPVATASACVVPEDISGTLTAISPEDLGGIRGYIERVFFDADGVTFVDSSEASSVFDKLATFYNKNDTKLFTIKLLGAVNEDEYTEEGQRLAGERVQSVKSELIKRGIPEDVVVEDGTVSVSSNEFTQDVSRSRSVGITIENDAACS